MSDEQPASLLHLLHRAAQVADMLFQKNMAPDQMTPRQWVVLAAVAENERASQTTLTRLTGIDRSTLTDIVRRLNKLGFIKRRRNRKDARAYQLELTADGRRWLAKGASASHHADVSLLTGMSVKQQKGLVEALQSLVPVEAGDAEPNKTSAAKVTRWSAGE